MIVETIVKKGAYYDSIKLMLAASELRHLPGIQDAAVVMGTEANKRLLEEAGLLSPAASAAGANDLVIVVGADSSAQAHGALAEGEALLRKEGAAASAEGVYRAKTIRGAVRNHGDANTAVISVAGRYAAQEARQALEQDLHVLLFSDNVTVEDERALKELAVARGLLLMGPGAGTAILNGVGLGFANAVPRGPVGIVSAAGTGLQEVSSLLARAGVGISQGLGVGGRDLSLAIGGLMMKQALTALQSDDETDVLVLISKPPEESVGRDILRQVAGSSKPTVVAFLGGDAKLVDDLPQAHAARTLEEAARLAARLAGGDRSPVQDAMTPDARALRRELAPNQQYARGLFSGGTLCYEAQIIWRDRVSIPVWSNAPLDPRLRLPHAGASREHSAIDLGEEEFTVGRLHPMMDNELRVRRLLVEAADPQVAVIMLDVVLGFGAHPDPATELAAALVEARSRAAAEGRQLVFVASVTGTAGDPQGYERQVSALQEAGAIVCASNAAAAWLAAAVVRADGDD